MPIKIRPILSRIFIQTISDMINKMSQVIYELAFILFANQKFIKKLNSIKKVKKIIL